MSGVSSRTRSKNVPLFHSFSLHGSSSKWKGSNNGDETESRKRKEKEQPFLLPDDVHVIFIDDDDEDEENVVSDRVVEGVAEVKKEVESEEFHEKICGASYENPIFDSSDEEKIEEDDVLGDVKKEVESDKFHEKDENFGEKNCGANYENPIFEEDDVLVDVKKEVESEGSEKIDEKYENFGEENPIFDDSDEEKIEEDVVLDDVKNEVESGESVEFNKKGENFDNLNLESDNEQLHSDDDSDSDESDSEDDTSDEDFEVDKVHEVSQSDEDNSSVSSYVNDDEEEEEKEEEEQKKEKKKKRKIFEEGDDENDDEEEKKKKRKIFKDDEKEKKIRISKKEFSLLDDLVKEVQDRKSGVSGEGLAGCESSVGAKLDKIEETDKQKNPVRNGSAKRKKIEEADKQKKLVKNESAKKEKIDQTDKQKNPVTNGSAKQKKIEETDKQKNPVTNGGSNYRGRVNICNSEKKGLMENNGGYRRAYNSHYKSKELRNVLKLLSNAYLGIKDTKMEEMKEEEKNDEVVDHRPRPVVKDGYWSLKEVVEVKKTESEEETEKLWAECEAALRGDEAESMIGKIGTKEAMGENKGSSSRCEHNLRLDEEIGLICRICGVVVTEIRHITEEIIDRYPNEGCRKRASVSDENVPRFDGSNFVPSDNESVTTSLLHKQGTVWDLISDVKESLYPHQQEGFEFIWKNVAGSTDLQKIKNANPGREGGCIISHAPGTGKTKLTIVFLLSYLKVFPKSLPVIIAPASLMLTWEDEFKKWDIDVPFHNLNSNELTGKEHVDGVRFNLRPSGEAMRMAKVYSWMKGKSILGISYELFKDLAGSKYSEKKKKHSKVERGDETLVLKNILLETPGLIVFDEGHTPRNKRSQIWKVLTESQSKKRIILSGTPFQNNFDELFNILKLLKPSFSKTIPNHLKKSCQNREQKKTPTEWSWEPVAGKITGNSSDDDIMQLKSLIDPFVHVHKGAILEKKLPGIKEHMLILKPDSYQKQVLGCIQHSSNFSTENKINMTSVHPSLLLESNDLLEVEVSAIDKDNLEKLRLNPYAGVKTKFLVELVRLCEAADEKVLVFSQSLDSLRLIKDQMKSVFNWTESKEILQLDGKLKFNDRQSIIRRFNDAKCNAKILLASTKACSEGISLVGASRVVLLDVVWNPSVEKQAISRCYRLGQTKVVYTYHLVTEGTAEYEKYCRQADKERMSELVFSAELTAVNHELKKCAVDFEDKILDMMKKHEMLKDMFV